MAPRPEYVSLVLSRISTFCFQSLCIKMKILKCQWITPHLDSSWSVCKSALDCNNVAFMKFGLEVSRLSGGGLDLYLTWVTHKCSGFRNVVITRLKLT